MSARVSNMSVLENLHLCHGNTYHSSDGLVPPDAFHSLTLSLKKLKSVHIESMDNMPHKSDQATYRIEICYETNLQALSRI